MTKRSHETSLVSRIKENPKAFYNTLKQVVRDKVGPFKDKEGALCMDPEGVVRY